MKPLSNETLAELNLKGTFAPKVWAFAPTVGCYACGLGIAVANEPGYCPVPLTFVNGTYDEMEAEADRLNEEYLELDTRAALRIIASTMFGKAGAAGQSKRRLT